MSNSIRRDQDFYAWANQQAGLLRAGRFSEADIGPIAEEIESMGNSEKRELVSRLTVLLTHLLKWQFQPERRGASWEATVTVQRDDLADLLADNPSLAAKAGAFLASAYRKAAITAVGETGLPKQAFPAECPWGFDQVMDQGFWPGG